jgi:hypothetical protein
MRTVAHQGIILASPSPNPKATPATVGASLATIGSGIVALVNAKNITIALIFAIIFFLGLVAVILLFVFISRRNQGE